MDEIETLVNEHLRAQGLLPGSGLQEVAVAAVRAQETGDDPVLSLPEGVTFRQQRTIAASDVIRSLNLEPVVEELGYW